MNHESDAMRYSGDNALISVSFKDGKTIEFNADAANVDVDYEWYGYGRHKIYIDGVSSELNLSNPIKDTTNVNKHKLLL